MANLDLCVVMFPDGGKQASLGDFFSAGREKFVLEEALHPLKGVPDHLEHARLPEGQALFCAYVPREENLKRNAKLIRINTPDGFLRMRTWSQGEGAKNGHGSADYLWYRGPQDLPLNIQQRASGAPH